MPFIIPNTISSGCKQSLDENGTEISMSKLHYPSGLKCNLKQPSVEETKKTYIVLYTYLHHMTPKHVIWTKDQISGWETHRISSTLLFFPLNNMKTNFYSMWLFIRRYILKLQYGVKLNSVMSVLSKSKLIHIDNKLIDYLIKQ